MRGLSKQHPSKKASKKECKITHSYASKADEKSANLLIRTVNQQSF